jgi:uncharacterized protein YukE
VLAALDPWERDAAGAASELRRAAELLEDHAARRARLASRWLPVWTGRHRVHFDDEVAAAAVTTRELADALRAAAARIEANLRQ